MVPQSPPEVRARKKTISFLSRNHNHNSISDLKIRDPVNDRMIYFFLKWNDETKFEPNTIRLETKVTIEWYSFVHRSMVYAHGPWCIWLISRNNIRSLCFEICNSLIITKLDGNTFAFYFNCSPNNGSQTNAYQTPYHHFHFMPSIHL